MARKFFLIERSLLEHWLWTSKEPFDKRSAWIDLIGMAAYIDHEGKNYEGKITTIKRGEIHTSMAALAEKWGWERRTVRRFLTVLASASMVSFSTTTNGKTGGTVITIENYDVYQAQSTVSSTVSSTVNGTTNAQRKHSEVTVNDTHQNKRNKEIKEINVFNSQKNSSHVNINDEDAWLEANAQAMRRK